jgi:hypothetical protein
LTAGFFPFQVRWLAHLRDKTFYHECVTALCEVAAFFAGKGRADIASSLLAAFCVGHKAASAALQAHTGA